MEKFGRETREYMTNELRTALKENANLFVTGFSKLKVPELQKLRFALKDASSTYLVVKNTMAHRVMKELKLDDLIGMVSGTCGVVVLGADPIAASKALANFKKNHETLDIRGGILDGAIISSEKIKELSDLPSREALLAMVVSGIYSPVTGFVNSLAGIIKKLVYALNAIKDKGGKQDGGREEGS